MPYSKFIKKYEIPETFRNNKIKSIFDYDKQKVVKEYDVNIPIEDKTYNIGLIIGSSGSGKTTIAKEVFKDYYYFNGFDWNNDKTIVDNFSEKFTPKQIVEILSKVGFNSPADWLKPYNILSNGQKFRVDLARVILENNEPVLFDEFTSVIDRQVAKIGCLAIQKFIRKENKKFIAISCHYDIIDWLQPNWIYDVDRNKFEWRELRQPPEIRLDIRRAKTKEWYLYKKYHYLSGDINKVSRCYVAEINNKPVAFCAILHFPHNIIKNFKKIHRIVVLPDYQGIGIGKIFLNTICEMYKEQKFRILLITSSPSFVFGLQKDKRWIMKRKPSCMAGQNNGIKALNRTTSFDRLTVSFEYIGNN